MQTFYDRYQAGERQQVWSDLIALREGVRQEPVYTDALAVARETMRRARLNIETLISRLHSLGYRFETEQSAAQRSADRMVNLSRQMETLRGSVGGPLAGNMKGLFDLMTSTEALRKKTVEQLKASAAKPVEVNPLEDPSIYSPATKEAGREVAKAERRLRGPLPISLKAWYENVESISFLGSHPDLNPTNQSAAQPMMYLSPSMLPGPVAEKRRQQVESLGFRVSSEPTGSILDQKALPDPFVIFPLEDLLGEVEDSDGSADSFIISPDDLQKAHISGDVYYVDLPDTKADLVFQDWKNGYFVDYLRRVFAWGGFPGWERHPNPPAKLIQELAHGLLPL